MESNSPKRVVGYLLALGAGATWGTTGPLSTGLYDLMPATSIGFWRVLLRTGAPALWGIIFRRDVVPPHPPPRLPPALARRALVALFPTPYPFPILLPHASA